MRRILFLATLLVLPVHSSAHIEQAALLTKVEHFQANSDDADRVFNLLTAELALPVVWTYEDFGAFASGGVSLGNVVLEVRRPTSRASPVEQFQGIAFEPSGSAAATAGRLTQSGVSFEGPKPYATRRDEREYVLWSILELPSMAPAGIRMFVCDYTDRDGVRKQRSSASLELRRRNGGALGIANVKELVVAVPNLQDTLNQWRLLLGPASETGPGAFALPDGPPLRFVEAKSSGIQQIVMSVASLEKARAFLARRGMTATAFGRGLRIDAAGISVPPMVLVEK